MKLCPGKQMNLFVDNSLLVMGLVPGLVDTSIGDAVWGTYVPEALEAGIFQAKPDPHVIEGGLERIQDAINVYDQGVSAKKIVVEIAKAA